MTQLIKFLMTIEDPVNVLLSTSTHSQIATLYFNMRKKRNIWFSIKIYTVSGEQTL